jgi:hypothetical protein
VAIDSRDKRASALLDIQGLPFPDGSLSNAVDRGWQLGFYAADLSVSYSSGSEPVLVSRRVQGFNTWRVLE